MKRPKGKRFKNLYEYRGEVWYERVVSGRRYRANTEASADTPGQKRGRSSIDPAGGSKSSRTLGEGGTHGTAGAEGGSVIRGDLS